MLSLTGTVLGMFGVTSFLVYAALARRASDALGDSLPVVKQVLGTEKATMLPVQCVDCGHQFEAAATDFLAKMACARLHTRKSPFHVHFQSSLAKIRKRLGRA